MNVRSSHLYTDSATSYFINYKLFDIFVKYKVLKFTFPQILLPAEHFTIRFINTFPYKN